MRNILITGGAGFIGSHLANHFHNTYPEYKIIVVDALTYASNKNNLDKDITLEVANICDLNKMRDIMKSYRITDIIHLAAESHVDNSIKNPNIFMETNVIGTHNLLTIAKEFIKRDGRFYHVSTDEVYGHLSLTDNPFTETTPYDPRSPYSASKASSDHLVRSYFHTFKLPILISNCSNNYGPHQHIEKLIPKTIINALNGDFIPVYGIGDNIRDWLWVGDHVSAIDTIFHKGRVGQTYNIGGDHEVNNLTIVKTILDLVGASEDRIKFVEDRKGHDLRYAIDFSKLKNELGWTPKYKFNKGIKETIEYYKTLMT